MRDRVLADGGGLNRRCRGESAVDACVLLLAAAAAVVLLAAMALTGLLLDDRRDAERR